MAALDSRLKNDPYNPALLRQKQLLYSAQISTIDSFCGNLVRDYFHVLNVNRDYRIGDNGEFKSNGKVRLLMTQWSIFIKTEIPILPNCLRLFHQSRATPIYVNQLKK